MSIGIYKITNPKGLVYIGQSKDIEGRFKDYKSYNCRCQIKIYRSLEKYGVDDHFFEVVEECSFENLNKRERYWQDYYNVLDRELGLNCQLTNTEENPRIFSEETRERQSQSRLGKKHSKETIKRLSNKSKGRFNRKVINTETGEIFDSIELAAISIKMKYSRFAAQLRGQNPNKTKMKYYE